MSRHRHPDASVPSRPTPPAPTAEQLGALGRLGRFVARHHRWVAVAWLLLVVFAGYLNAADQKDISNDFRIPDTGSQSAYDILQERFSSQNAATATAVFSVPDGQQLSSADNAAAVAAAVAALGKAPNVASAANPLDTTSQATLAELAAAVNPGQPPAVAGKNFPASVSENGQIAYTTVTFDKTLPDLLEAYPLDAEKAASAYENPYTQLQAALDDLPASSVTVDIGGTVADTYNQPVSWWANHADEVGLGIGALLLLIAFGSLWGMAIPIATALFGAVTAGGFVYLLASVTTVSSAAPPVTLMISIGVGLDYSLLIVTRHRQFLQDGYEPHDAVGLALASAGKAALFAGLTVCIALLGLWLVPIPLVQTLGLSAAIGVAVMIVAAMTLLPTLLGFAGAKIDRFRLPSKHRDAPIDPEKSFWGRFATTMAKRPWLTLTAGLVVLIALAMPFLSINFGMPDDSSLPSDLSQRNAFQLVQEGFGPGANGPLLVVVALPTTNPGSYQAALPQLDAVNKAVGAFQPAGTVTNVEYAVGPIPNDPTDDHRGDLRGHPVDRARRPRHQAAGHRPPVERRAGHGRYRPPGLRRRQHRHPDRPHHAGRPVPATGHRGGRAGGVHPAGAGVPVDPRAAQGRADEPDLDRRRLRRGGRGLPVGLGPRAGGAVEHDPHRLVRAPRDVRDPVRALHGLRGLPHVPHPRGVGPHR